MRLLPALFLLCAAACQAPVVNPPAPTTPAPQAPLQIKIGNINEKGQQRLMPEIFDLLPAAEKPRFVPFEAYRSFHDDDIVHRGLCDNMLQFTDAEGHVQRRCGGHIPGRNERPPALPAAAPSSKTAEPGKTPAK
ncbi:MAG: hypothetical protein RL095_206 [Verrucomicrobiota bacterium]|jgi:hypothetical protein